MNTLKSNGKSSNLRDFCHIESYIDFLFNWIYKDFLHYSLLSSLLQVWSALSGTLMFPKICFQFFLGLHTAEVFWSQPAESCINRDQDSERLKAGSNTAAKTHVSSTEDLTIQTLLAALDQEFSAAVVPCFQRCCKDLQAVAAAALQCWEGFCPAAAAGWRQELGTGCLVGYDAEKSGSFCIDQVRWKAIKPSGRLPLSIATAFVWLSFFFFNLMLEATPKVHILRGQRIWFVKDCTFYLNDESWKGHAIVFWCPQKSFKAIFLSKLENTKWLSGLTLAQLNLSSSCFAFVFYNLTTIVPLPLNNLETCSFSKFMASLEINIFCGRSYTVHFYFSYFQ